MADDDAITETREDAPEPEVTERPPEPEYGHDLGPFTLHLHELVMPAMQMKHGVFRFSCALCNWVYEGQIQVGEVYAQYHVDVVHHQQMGALKVQFKKTKEELKRRVEQSKKDKKKTAEEAKRDFVKKLEEEDEK